MLMRLIHSSNGMRGSLSHLIVGLFFSQVNPSQSLPRQGNKSATSASTPAYRGWRRLFEQFGYPKVTKEKPSPARITALIYPHHTSLPQNNQYPPSHASSQLHPPLSIPLSVHQRSPRPSYPRELVGFLNHLSSHPITRSIP